MADRSRYDDAEVTEAAATVVERLDARQADVTRALQQRLDAEIGELRGDSQLQDLLGASVEGNVDTIFHAVRYDIPIARVEPPTAALEYARRLAQHGVPVHALVRAYRLGHQTLLDMVHDEIGEMDLDPALRLAVFDRMTTVTFRYADWISQQVIEVYETERERWLENRSRVQAARVSEILAGGNIDVDAMTRAIRYPLRRTHIALILWFPDGSDSGNELIRLERFLHDLAEALGTGNALFLAADRISGWGWIPLGVESPKDPIAGIRRFAADHPQAPHVALGGPLPGVDGFRRSHRQAQVAHSVAIAARQSAPRLVAASDPGLGPAAFMGTNIAEARIWVRDILGLLSTDSDNDAMLRETLRVFLREGSSLKAAADLLNLHSNSVKYRIQRAIERRGRPIKEDRLDVELALLACQWFGSDVLEPDRRGRK